MRNARIQPENENINKDDTESMKTPINNNNVNNFRSFHEVSPVRNESILNFKTFHLPLGSRPKLPMISTNIPSKQLKIQSSLNTMNLPINDLNLELLNDKTKDILQDPSRVSRTVKERQVNAIQKEFEISKKKLYIMGPDSNVRLAWDILTALTTIALAIRLPYTIAFDIEDYHQSHYQIFSYATDVIYIMDILMNFRTGYQKDVEIIMNPNDIAKNYIKGWFLIDFIGSVPLEYFLSQIIASSIQRKAFKTSVRYLKIPKLFRLARIVRLVKKYMQYMHSLQLILLYLSFIHWVACLCGAFIVVPGTYTTSWAAYSDCLYISIEIMLNSGSVEVENRYKVYVSFLYIFGFIFHAMCIASFTSIILTTTSRTIEYQEKVKTVLNDLKALHVPKDIRTNAKRYYNALWSVRHTSYRFEQAIYNDEDLSPGIRAEIALHIHRSLITTVPLFRSCNDSCLAFVVMKLKTHLYMTNQVIFFRGEPGICMMIINRGRVSVRAGDDKAIIAVLKEGSFFGEMGLLRNQPRSRTVIAETFCELRSLNQGDAEEIFRLYPQIYDRLWQEVHQRIKTNTKNEGDKHHKVLDNIHAVNKESIDPVELPNLAIQETNNSDKYLHSLLANISVTNEDANHPNKNQSNNNKDRKTEDNEKTDTFESSSAASVLTSTSTNLVLRHEINQLDNRIRQLQETTQEMMTMHIQTLSCIRSLMETKISTMPSIPSSHEDEMKTNTDNHTDLHPGFKESQSESNVLDCTKKAKSTGYKITSSTILPSLNSQLPSHLSTLGDDSQNDNNNQTNDGNDNENQLPARTASSATLYLRANSPDRTVIPLDGSLFRDNRIQPRMIQNSKPNQIINNLNKAP